MLWFDVCWSPDIEAHLAEHNVTRDEFEWVVLRQGRSKPTRFPVAKRSSARLKKDDDCGAFSRILMM